jgi:hypothetical protein
MLYSRFGHDAERGGGGVAGSRKWHVNSTAPVGQGLPHCWGFKITLRHTHLVGLLSTSDRLDAETSTWQHTAHTRHIHVLGGTRTRNPSKPSAADPHLGPRGDWDRCQRSCAVSTLFNHLHTWSKIFVFVILLPHISSRAVHGPPWTARLHNRLVCRNNIDFVYNDEHNKNHTCSFS